MVLRARKVSGAFEKRTQKTHTHKKRTWTLYLVHGRSVIINHISCVQRGKKRRMTLLFRLLFRLMIMIWKGGKILWRGVHCVLHVIYKYSWTKHVQRDRGLVQTRAIVQTVPRIISSKVKKKLSIGREVVALLKIACASQLGQDFLFMTPKLKLSSDSTGPSSLTIDTEIWWGRKLSLKRQP